MCFVCAKLSCFTKHIFGVQGIAQLGLLIMHLIIIRLSHGVPLGKGHSAATAFVFEGAYWEFSAVVTKWGCEARGNIYKASEGKTLVLWIVDLWPAAVNGWRLLDTTAFFKNLDRRMYWQIRVRCGCLGLSVRSWLGSFWTLCLSRKQGVVGTWNSVLITWMFFSLVDLLRVGVCGFTLFRARASECCSPIIA